MEQVGRIGWIGENKRDRKLVSFILLFSLSLVGAAFVGDAYGVQPSVITITPERLQKFVAFYRENFFAELGVIFLNNSLAAILLIYFTPMALRLNRQLGYSRQTGCRLTVWDRFMMYGFPVFFLIKQGAAVGISLAGFAAQIRESLLKTFLGIIFPHLTLEALALCLAAALGLEVTRQSISGAGPGGFGVKTATLLVVGLLALAALLEVALTPKIFAFVMLS